MLNYHNDDDNHEVVSKKEVVLHNARLLDPPASLDTQGFALFQAGPSLLSTEDFDNPDFVRKEYYAEVRDIVREMTGASDVGVLDHRTLWQQTTSADATSNHHPSGGEAGPVPRVHCDYTLDSAPHCLKTLAETRGLLMVCNEPVDPELVELVFQEGKRFAFINVWRSIDMKNPVSSLAVCDARSVSKEDRICRGETYALRHHDNHKWYTYPRMKFSECLVFTAFDTVEPQFVFHSALTDTQGGDFLVPPRQSIEVRTIALFGSS